ncbi:hypothetical protein [Sporisorium scitamineum]|uniref:Uncharacterized protein n=1 Tax=Sporisorium scitamineum TaxID=49012 RepID=A0A0F7S8E5_9BASI|nr:hypothetical protein [Sporisorium scitamineum]
MWLTCSLSAQANLIRGSVVSSEQYRGVDALLDEAAGTSWL